MKKAIIILIILAIAVAIFTGDVYMKDNEKEKAVNKTYATLNQLASVQGRTIDASVRGELYKLTTPELYELDVFATKVVNKQYLDTLGSLQRMQTILRKTDIYNLVLGLLTQRY